MSVNIILSMLFLGSISSTDWVVCVCVLNCEYWYTESVWTVTWKDIGCANELVDFGSYEQAIRIQCKYCFEIRDEIWICLHFIDISFYTSHTFPMCIHIKVGSNECSAFEKHFQVLFYTITFNMDDAYKSVRACHLHLKLFIRWLDIFLSLILSWEFFFLFKQLSRPLLTYRVSSSSLTILRNNYEFFN